MRGLRVAETELLRIWQARQALSAEIVVEEATPAGSPLHPLFEWDDSRAAHEYRLDQARDLIRSVKLRVTRQEPGDGQVDDYQVRQWTAASRAAIDLPPGHYVPTGSLDGRARQALIQRMARELQQSRRRYQGFPEYWQQLDAMVAEHNDGDRQAS